MSAFHPHPPHEDLVVLALGDLDDATLARVEGHLEVCDVCRQEYVGLIETLASVAYAAPSQVPPTELRTAILHAVAIESQGVSEPVPSGGRRRIGWAGWPGWGGWAPRLAVSAGVAMAIIVVMVVLSQSSATTRTIPLQGVAGTVQVTDHHAVLETAAFRPPPIGRVYELWVIHGGKARPAGLFQNIRVPVAVGGSVGSGDVVAVTQEPAPGSAQPTSTPVATARI